MPTDRSEMKSQLPVLRRRMPAAGTVAAGFYLVLALMLLFTDTTASSVSVSAALALAQGMLYFFVGGSLGFGLLPHLIGHLMNRRAGFLAMLNHAALFLALISVAIGVLAALMLIFGKPEAGKALAVAITLFVGASATMCSLKFFHANREQE